LLLTIGVTGLSLLFLQLYKQKKVIQKIRDAIFAGFRMNEKNILQCTKQPVNSLIEDKKMTAGWQSFYKRINQISFS
jgi:hypothetical protein